MKKLLRSLIWLNIFGLLISWGRAETSPSVPPRDRILILLSLDGFRWDYLQTFHPANLNRIAATGVSAKRLIPSFPSLTLPNHHTIATGLRPEHHGIIHNNFYDATLGTNFNIFNNPGATN